MTKEEFRARFREAIWSDDFPVWDLSSQDADDLADAAVAQAAPLFEEITRLHQRLSAPEPDIAPEGRS